MIVISDTSPINYLILIDKIHILSVLYGKVIVPKAVLEELTRDGAPKAVSHWAVSMPDWVEVRVPNVRQTFTGLDDGESDAISLALELKADFVLIDERKGRRVAGDLGLRVSGTVVILEQAGQQDLIDLAGTISKLKQTNFHISDQALQSVLDRDLRRRQNQDSNK